MKLLLHWYVKDHKLVTPATHPERLVSALADRAGGITPDFTMRTNDREDRRIFATWMNRAVGAFLVSRGIEMVPNARWSSSHDWHFAFDGIEDRSAVSVSNLGCWRDGTLRQTFVPGLEALIDKVNPEVIYLHGTLNHPRLKQLQRQHHIVHIPTHWASIGETR
jgi:hypothetical protein